MTEAIGALQEISLNPLFEIPKTPRGLQNEGKLGEHPLTALETYKLISRDDIEEPIDLKNRPKP